MNGHHVSAQQQQQHLYNHLAANSMNGLQSGFHGHGSSNSAGLVGVNDLLGGLDADAIYRWKSECVHCTLHQIFSRNRNEKFPHTTTQFYFIFPPFQSLVPVIANVETAATSVMELVTLV